MSLFAARPALQLFFPLLFLILFSKLESYYKEMEVSTAALYFWCMVIFLMDF